MEKNDFLAFVVTFDVAECCSRLVKDFNQISDLVGWRKSRKFFQDVLTELTKELERAGADKMLSELKEKNSKKNK